MLLLQEGSGSRGHQSQHMHACMPDYNRRLSLCTPCMHHSQPPTHFSTENLGQLGASTAFQNILTFQYSVRLYVPKASGCLPSRPYCTVSGTGISSGFSSPRSLAYAAMISVIETCTGKSIPVMRSACIHFDHYCKPSLAAHQSGATCGMQRTYSNKHLRQESMCGQRPSLGASLTMHLTHTPPLHMRGRCIINRRSHAWLPQETGGWLNSASAS